MTFPDENAKFPQPTLEIIVKYTDWIQSWTNKVWTNKVF